MSNESALPTIGVIASAPDERGITPFVQRDVQEWLRRGYGVNLYLLRNRGGLYLPPEGVRVFHHPLWRVVVVQAARFLRAPKRYFRVLREAIEYRALGDFLVAEAFAPQLADVDLLFAYFGDHKFFVGHFCKRITRIPLFVSIRAYELYDNPNPKLFRHALTACDRIFSNSIFNREYLAEHFDVPREDVEVVRIILDLEQHRPRPRFTILVVGYFMEKKGHDVLFEAVRRLGHEDIELWVVGDEIPADNRSVDCRKLAREMGMTDQVAFFGLQNGVALRALYRECDVFCLPSRVAPDGDREGFPNAIAEAMAFGKPVISTDHAEIPNVLDQIIVPENDPVGLAEAIDQLYRSAATRQRQGRQNRRKAEETFSSRNIDRLEEALWACVPKGEKRRAA